MMPDGGTHGGTQTGINDIIHLNSICTESLIKNVPYCVGSSSAKQRCVQYTCWLSTALTGTP